MLIRFRPEVIDLKPKAVVILAGTNDIAGNTGPALDEQIEGNLAEDLSGDDLHPNATGYAVMAPLAEAAIQRAVK